MHPASEHFSEALGQISERAHGSRAGQGDVELARLLSALRVELAAYFAAEEGDANFGAVVRERPGMAHALDGLRCEHTELLEKLDRLRVVAADGQRERELTRLTYELAEALRAHEHKEADVLQELVLRDDGTGAD